MCLVSGCPVNTARRFSEIPSRKLKSPPFIRWCKFPWAPTRLAILKFATAKLKMKTLTAGVPMALCSTAIQFSDRHSNRSFFLLRIADLVVDVADVLDVSVSQNVAFPSKWASCIFMHCFNATANYGRCRRSFWGPSAFKRRIQCMAFCNRSARRSCLVVSLKSDTIERYDFLFANIVRPPTNLGIFLDHTILRESSDGSHVFLLSCFLKHLLRLEKHYLSFRCTMLWSSTGILLSDKVRDRSKVVISLLDCCMTFRLYFKISPATAINDPVFFFF